MDRIQPSARGFLRAIDARERAELRARIIAIRAALADQADLDRFLAALIGD